MVLVVALAVGAMLVAGQVGRIFDALVGFDDGGALARWGIPVSRAVLDASAALTIGLLLLAGTMIPERNSTDRRRTACRIAVISGVVWVLAGVMLLLASIANLSGIAMTDPAFGAQVASVAWGMPYFRIILISTIVAAGATLLASVARTPTQITWAAALGFVSLAFLALIGHAAGAAAHDTAVNSIGVHLVAAAGWMGGLAGLVILRPILGNDLGTVVARFSHLALWGYVAIAISGVLNATLRIRDLDGLTSTYGLLLTVKVVAFLVLGVIGWRMRSSLVARLQGDAPESGAFARLALLEVGIMAVAGGVAVALSRTAPPVSQESSPDIVTSLTGYPDPGAPTSADWLTAFRPDWLFLAAALLGIGLYVAGVVRLHRRGDSWPWHRTVLWVLGWLVFVWTTSGYPAIWGRVTFSAHMLMHMSLTMAAPPLLAFGAPLTLASRALKARRDKTMGPREILLATAHSRWMNFWANPVIGGINFAGSLYIFYFTGLFDLALRTHLGHIVMVVHFMLAGYVFCWSLIGVDPGPKRWPASLRLVLLFATMSFHAFFGVALLSMRSLLAPDFFPTLRLPWVGDLLADQMKGGAITWGIGEIPMLFLALMVAFTWMRSDEHEAKRRDRQADRDHDAELEAYNESLRRRGEAMRRAELADAARHPGRHHGHGASTDH